MATQPLGPLWPRTSELHRQSRDCPGMATQPLCQNARVTPAVLGLSRDRMTTQPLGHSCQSIPEHRSYTSSPGMATQPLGPLWLAEYPRTPELHRQSRDCPGMTTQPLCQGIPEHWSYTSSPGIVLGRLPSPWDLSGRVSQNAGVTPAVPGLSQDDYPTPLSEYPRTPELHQLSWDIVPG